MRRETLSVLGMGILLAGSQLIAIGIAPLFAFASFQAFPEPDNPTNAVVYLVLILVFTAVILAFVKLRRRNVARGLILASIFLTLAFILLLPLFFLLVWINDGIFNSEFGGNLATLLAFVLAGLLIVLLVKVPEWYVVDTIGFATAAGVTAIMGISFSILPALILLVALAAYDAWAVYRTKHMVALADELTSQRLPVLLVVPKHRGYKFSEQKSLKEQLAEGEEREAMFIGLGDLIIPGIMAVSARAFLRDDFGLQAGPVPPSGFVALAAIAGTLVGFAILMRFVLKGNPQAGLPLLNGGAIAGFFLGVLLVYGTVVPPLAP